MDVGGRRSHVRLCGLGQQSRRSSASSARLPSTNSMRCRVPECWRIPRCMAAAPVGKLDQPDFINAVAKLQTELSAAELMRALQAIETKHHRVRGEANAPRTLDLDLLLFGNEIIHETSLTVPHPRMHERAFVLMPLAEISGEQTTIPGRGTVAELAGASRGSAHKETRCRTGNIATSSLRVR